jgi:hypothetical protein
MRGLHLLTLMSLVLSAPAALAQAQPRTLAAEAGSPWTHRLTKMVLPATVAGLTRGEIEDATAAELDVTAQYHDQTRDLLVLVYIYKPGISDVAIWFDRAALAMRTSPGHGLEGVTLPAPVPFARPGAPTAAGLRLVMDVPGPGFKSTALAIAPVGEWLVKVHMGSRSLDRAALEAKLDAIMAALGWPAEAGAPRAAAAILPCPTPLKTKQAKFVRDDMASVLINAVSFSIEREGPPPIYCREPGLATDFGVYRPNGDHDSYVVTLNDAGVALSVGPSLGGLLGGSNRKTYSLSLLDHGSASVMPSFNRLPPPAQAVSVAEGKPQMISTTPPR